MQRLKTQHDLATQREGGRIHMHLLCFDAEDLMGSTLPISPKSVNQTAECGSDSCKEPKPPLRNEEIGHSIKPNGYTGNEPRDAT